MNHPISHMPSSPPCAGIQPQARSNPFKLRRIADDLTALTVNLAVGLATGAVLAESVWRVVKAL